MTIQNSPAYIKLLTAVQKDQVNHFGAHDYYAKLQWIVKRSEHYAQATGLPAETILEAWELHRNYWYMNYYQECNQPTLDKAKVFEALDDFCQSFDPAAGFRCPYCKKVSLSAYSCDSCGYRVGGLLRGVRTTFVFVKEPIVMEEIFLPVSWEGNQRAD